MLAVINPWNCQYLDSLRSVRNPVTDLELMVATAPDLPVALFPVHSHLHIFTASATDKGRLSSRSCVVRDALQSPL